MNSLPCILNEYFHFFFFLKILESFLADDKLLNDSHAFEHMVTYFGVNVEVVWSLPLFISIFLRF